jgi:signal transduction histidine kinase
MGALRPRIDQMSALIDESIRNVRRVAADLRPAVLDDLGLTAALEWLVREFSSRSGLQCTLQVHVDERQVTPQVAITLFRILQEALTNVARHAQASTVHTSLTADAHALVLQVTDDGRGIESGDVFSPGSIGLTGMRQRAESVGGSLSINGDQHGTVLVARVPARQAEEAT